MGGLADHALFLVAAYDQQVADNDGAGGDADAHLQANPVLEFQVRYRFDQPERGANGLFRIVLMRFRITEIGEDAIAHIAGDDTLVIANDLRDLGMVAADDSAQIFRVEPRRAPEPTMSQNSTVSCRRSAVSCGLPAADENSVPAVSAISPIARNSLRRWPSGIPMSLRSASDRSVRIEKSTACSLKSCRYSGRPIAPSHSSKRSMSRRAELSQPDRIMKMKRGRDVSADTNGDAATPLREAPARLPGCLTPRCQLNKRAGRSRRLFAVDLAKFPVACVSGLTVPDETRRYSRMRTKNGRHPWKDDRSRLSSTLSECSTFCMAWRGIGYAVAVAGVLAFAYDQRIAGSAS